MTTSIITWPYVLRKGHSANPSNGACAMDAVNWLVHGKHGDHPVCACPLITAYVIDGNDRMPHDTRQRLLPYLHRIAGSRSDAHVGARLRIMVMGALRVAVPSTLDVIGLTKHATALRSLHRNEVWQHAGMVLKPASAAVKKIVRDTRVESVLEVALRTPVKELGSRTAKARQVGAARVACSAAVAALYSAIMRSAAIAVPLPANAAAALKGAGGAASAARSMAAAAQLRSVSEMARSTDWDDYFMVLDQALNAGPQGSPWSADQMEVGTGLYASASGRLVPAGE